MFRHYFFGAHSRTCQIRFEFEGFGSWDRMLALLKKDAKYERLLEEWQKRALMNSFVKYYFKVAGSIRVTTLSHILTDFMDLDGLVFLGGGY